MIKSYKVRIYPTKEQELKMLRHIGACRYFWNYMLSIQMKRYEDGEKHFSVFDMIKQIKYIKDDGEHDWLHEISNKSLECICRDLGRAYDGFFKKQNGFPKFKSKKRTKVTYPARTDNFYLKDSKVLNIEKIGKVRYKTNFDLPVGKAAAQFSNVRVSNVNGKWMVSFGLECENQAPELTDISMGIDLGVKDLATVEFSGEQIVFHNINKSKRMRTLQKQLKHTQRSISRKYEQNRQGNRYVKTNNIIREENKLRKIHARIANIRHNYIHQTTHALISKLPCRVVMEDLNVVGMMKNRHLSKAIGEQCFAEFIRQMKYKCEWNGIEFIQADRFYPSSKTCSCCGLVKSNLKLSDRTYVCESCGLVIDRDYNAAINLSRYIA